MEYIALGIFLLLGLLILTSFVNIVIKQFTGKALLPVQFNHFVHSAYTRIALLVLIAIACYIQFTK